MNVRLNGKVIVEARAIPCSKYEHTSIVYSLIFFAIYYIYNKTSAYEVMKLAYSSIQPVWSLFTPLVIVVQP